MKKLCFMVLAAFFAVSLAAAELFTFTPVDAMPVYKCGEKAAFTVTAAENGKYTIVYLFCGGKEIGRQTVELVNGKAETIHTTLSEPGFILVKVYDAKGKLITTLDTKGRKIPVLAGAAFEPEKIKMGYDMPEDFMAFWEAGRKQIANNPVKLEKDKRSNARYTVYYVTVKTLHDETLTGYLTIPAGKGPFPVYITVPGAGPGVSGPSYWCAKGVISLAMNVHKFPTADNDAEQKARYTANTKGKPRYSIWGVGSRDTYFFRSVYVGIDRVINYVAAMPEWDKKHMVIDGSSQGGGAALLLAGFNQNITALAANVPSMSDHGGYKSGRASGGPRLSKTENVDAYAPYFDAGNFAKFIKVPALVSCGFLDTTCSPSSIYAVYNQLKGPKQMIHVPLEGHTTSKIYVTARDKFIAEQLGLTAR